MVEVYVKRREKHTESTRGMCSDQCAVAVETLVQNARVACTVTLHIARERGGVRPGIETRKVEWTQSANGGRSEARI